MKRKQKKDINIPIIALLALLLIMLIIVTAITLILNNFKGTDTSNEKNNIVSNSQERPKEYVRLDTVYPMEFDKFLNYIDDGEFGFIETLKKAEELEIYSFIILNKFM